MIGHLDKIASIGLDIVALDILFYPWNGVVSKYMMAHPRHDQKSHISVKRDTDDGSDFLFSGQIPSKPGNYRNNHQSVDSVRYPVKTQQL